MLESLLGSVNKERVLLFVYARGEGYPRDIARYFDTYLSTSCGETAVKEIRQMNLGELAAPQ